MNNMLNNNVLTNNMLTNNNMLTTKFSFTFAGQSCEVDENDILTWGDKTLKAGNTHGALRYALEMERQKSLGIPTSVRFYLNERYLDKWTVMFLDKKTKEGYFCLAMQDSGEADEVYDIPGFHLGARVWLSDMPEVCQLEVLRECRR